MPVKVAPAITGVTVDWQGDNFRRTVQGALRRALVQVGEESVQVAREPEHVRRNTEALANSIKYKVPRRSPGSTVYTLEFGVFPGASEPGNVPPRGPTGNTRPGERAEDYAFWQEVDPIRGRPYIRPTVAEVWPHIALYIDANFHSPTGQVNFNVGNAIIEDEHALLGGGYGSLGDEP